MTERGGGSPSLSLFLLQTLAFGVEISQRRGLGSAKPWFEQVGGTLSGALAYNTATSQLVCLVYRGTSLIRKRTPLGAYRRPMPGILGGS